MDVLLRVQKLKGIQLEKFIYHSPLLIVNMYHMKPNRGSVCALLLRRAEATVCALPWV